MKKFILSLFIALIATLSYSQVGLDNVIIEEIDASSVMAGATTYRVFLDLEAGYELQLIKGDENCSLLFGTTTTWYNTLLGGASSNNIIGAIIPSFPEIGFDSYLSHGGATGSDEWAVLYADDTDGTVDGRMVIAGNNVPMITFVGGDITTSTDNNFGTAVTQNAFSETMGGSYGTITSNADIAPNNRLMIGQFTTDGVFTFSINIQIKEVGTTNVISLTACDVPILNFPPAMMVFGCMDAAACNFDSDANTDDGSCLIIGESCDDSDANTINDVITVACICEGAVIVSGCMNANACNFNASANVDDGSCLITGDACDDNDANTINDVITADCICEGSPIVSGCTDGAACNFNADANTEDGSCILVGDSCDDGDANTEDDVIIGDCTCEGSIIDGIDDISGNDSELVIYPNPAQNDLFLNFQLKEAGQITFEIFDVLGNGVKSTVSTLNSGEVTHSLNTESLRAGMYILRISNGVNTATQRFSIVR
ncbi:MAG: hypothetical protein ACI8XB_001926 [Patiriisocius sp.]|jgi:hypothetical protein